MLLLSLELDDNSHLAVKKVDGRGQDAEREFEVYIIVGGGVVVLVHFFSHFFGNTLDW